jgi:hypothetical protein
MVSPCSCGSVSPFVLEDHRREDELEVRAWKPGPQRDKGRSLGHVGSQRPAPEEQVAREVERRVGAEERRGARRRRQQPADQVVLQVAPDAGEVVDWSDPHGLELAHGPDPRQEQQLRRAHGAGAEDHLALRPYRLASRQLDPSTTPLLEDDPHDVRSAPDREVRAGPCRPQVAVGHAPTAPAALVDGAQGGLRDATLRGRLEERKRQRTGVAQRAEHEPRGRGPLEARLQVVPPPPRDLPAVVVGREPAQRDLRVDRRAAADHLAPREVDLAPAESRLRHRPVAPVDLAPVQPRERGGNPDLPPPGLAARLEQEHPRRGILAQPGGQHAAGRPGSHDHVVEPVQSAYSSRAFSRRIRRAAHCASSPSSSGSTSASASRHHLAARKYSSGVRAASDA